MPGAALRAAGHEVVAVSGQSGASLDRVAEPLPGVPVRNVPRGGRRPGRRLRRPERGAGAVPATTRAGLRRARGLDVDYRVVTDPDLAELPADLPPGTPGRLLAAVRAGGSG